MGLDEQLDVFPDRVLAHVKQAPLRLAVYLGRAEEVGADGEITATVWETPSGREAVTILDPKNPAIVPGVFDPPPVVGDALRIWTWIELAADSTQLPRIFFEVVPPEFSDTDLDEIDDDLLAELEERKP